MAKKGVFIVLEGLDGSGTTTQTRLLDDWFAGDPERYGKCLSTFEPTQGPLGSILRLALSRSLSFDDRTMALLFAADRTDHLYREAVDPQGPGIAHHLQDGIHVVSDRYMLSSLAYQSLNLPMEWVYEINAYAITPDICFFLDIDPQVSEKRLILSRSHRELYEASETQIRVGEQYEKAISFLMAKGHRICRVDANRPEGDVLSDITTELIPLLG